MTANTIVRIGAPKKEYCKHGHKIAEVGRTKGGECKECRRIANRGRYKSQPKSPEQKKAETVDGRFCKRGHDTSALGRGHNRRCKQCERDDSRERRVRERMPPVYEVEDRAIPVPGLRVFRESLGFSVEELAEEAEVSVDDLTLYESGDLPAYPETRVALWHALQMLDHKRRERREEAREMALRPERAGVV